MSHEVTLLVQHPELELVAFAEAGCFLRQVHLKILFICESPREPEVLVFSDSRDDSCPSRLYLNDFVFLGQVDVRVVLVGLAIEEVGHRPFNVLSAVDLGRGIQAIALPEDAQRLGQCL